MFYPLKLAWQLVPSLKRLGYRVLLGLGLGTESSLPSFSNSIELDTSGWVEGFVLSYKIGPVWLGPTPLLVAETLSFRPLAVGSLFT